MKNNKSNKNTRLIDVVVDKVRIARHTCIHRWDAGRAAIPIRYDA